jgi:hydrogenase maturation factor HypF (carbamoyltransferase family)
MKVESASGIVHSVKEVVDSRYFDNIAVTKCGCKFNLVGYVPFDGEARKISYPISCKNCKRRK